MKKLILIISLVLPFLANGQDYRVVDWKTDVLNVQTVGIDTFKFDAEPKDYNDAGAITREIGNYFIDYVARCFKIINSDANTITVVDLEHINSAPQSNQIGRVYQSVVDADSLFQSIGGVDISVLDQMSIYRDVARNNEIICRLLKELAAKDTTGIYHANRELLNSITPEDTTRWATGGLITETDPTVSALVKSIDATDTTYWGRAETDPTISAWAKAATKPTYTYSEVGAQPAGSYATTTQLADQLSQTISNGITTKAPSEDAVYDALTGKATISGTDNYIMKKTGANTLGNSSISDNGSTISTTLPFSSNISLAAPTLFAGSSYWNPNFFELGYGQIGNRYSIIDLTGDDTYSDFGLRIIRSNTGENAPSTLLHRGKGVFSIYAQDAGRVFLGTKNTPALTIDTLQNVGIGTTTPIAELHIKKNTTETSIIVENDGGLGGAAYEMVDNASGARWKFKTTNMGGFKIRNTLKGFDVFYIDSLTNNQFSIINNNVGIGTTTPAARVHSQSTTTQLRLGYDATKYTDFTVGSGGNLIVNPTGDTVKVVGAVNSTGGFFKNGVEITGGSGSMIFPINSGIVTYNGTTWGTSITNNSNLWNNAYDKKIVSAAFSGTSTKTLTLYQQDGNVLQAAFTDESGGGSMTWPNQAGIAVYSGSGTWSTSKSAPSGAIVGTTDNQALTNKSVNGVTLSTAQGTTNFLRGDGTYAAPPSGGSGMVYPSAGIPVSTGSSWGTSKAAPSGTIVGTTDSQVLTNKSVNGVTLSTGAGASNFLAGDGTYKTVTGSSKWTADTYGINYQSGNVGIGVTANQSNKLRVETAVTSAHAIVGISSSGIGIIGSSISDNAVHGVSGTSNGVYGTSGSSNGVYGTSSIGFGGFFEGLGCKATKFYVSSLNTAPASSSATGTTGEIRFTSDYIYVCVATNTWKRTQISTW